MNLGTVVLNLKELTLLSSSSVKETRKTLLNICKIKGSEEGKLILSGVNHLENMIQAKARKEEARFRQEEIMIGQM